MLCYPPDEIDKNCPITEISFDIFSDPSQFQDSQGTANGTFDLFPNMKSFEFEKINRTHSYYLSYSKVQSNNLPLIDFVISHDTPCILPSQKFIKPPHKLHPFELDQDMPTECTSIGADG